MKALVLSASLSPFLKRWELAPFGAIVQTTNASILPVKRLDGSKAMLRRGCHPDERSGLDILEAWGGVGCAKVYAREGSTALIELADGSQRLTDMAQGGNDAQATRILCATSARLHEWRGKHPATLVPLEQWFRALIEPTQSGILLESATVAKRLLANQRDCVALHGDLHHANVLNFGLRGWLAIDPKGLLGDRAFEYGVLFGNPDLADPSRPVAAAAFERRFVQVAHEAALDPSRLRDWIIAWAGLSASWFIEDGSPLAALPLSIAERARALPIP